MVGQVKTVNGVKKIVPLTAEARAGNPVSTIIAIYSNLVPYGYLPCNGVQFDETQFPALYAILGDNHTPDLRECALVGAGQNATDTIATHDVYDVGQFKDDQLQNHGHFFRQSTSVGGSGNVGTYGGTFVAQNSGAITTVASARYGDTTHGKQKGVNYCIKATAGLDESDADYVLGVLAPVDEVAVNNMHSVTSNAVANSISYSETEIKTGGKWIDGKPIYRKVINFGALPNTAKRSVVHNIANLDYFTSIKGIAVNTSSGYKQTLTLPYASGGTLAESVAIYTNYTRVEVGTGNDRSGYNICYIVLEYTKTTD